MKKVTQVKPQDKTNFNLNDMSAKKKLHIYAELCISEDANIAGPQTQVIESNKLYPVSFSISNDCKKLFVYKAQAVIKIFNSMKRVVLIKTASSTENPTIFDLKVLKNGRYIIEANRQKYIFRYTRSQTSFAAYLLHFFNR